MFVTMTLSKGVFGIMKYYIPRIHGTIDSSSTTKPSLDRPPPTHTHSHTSSYSNTCALAVSCSLEYLLPLFVWGTLTHYSEASTNVSALVGPYNCAFHRCLKSSHTHNIQVWLSSLAYPGRFVASLSDHGTCDFNKSS